MNLNWVQALPFSIGENAFTNKQMPVSFMWGPIKVPHWNNRRAKALNPNPQNFVFTGLVPV